MRLSGRGAVVVVPDYRDLDRVEAALLQLLPAGDVARLTADDGQTPRYRSFLRILSGAAGVAVGTRSAAYAPVRNLGLVVCWMTATTCTSSSAHPMPTPAKSCCCAPGRRAPRACSPAHTRSTETQRLVEAGWAWPVEADRAVVRRTVPRVLNTADSYELEHDPLARIARLPGAAGAPPRTGSNAARSWSRWRGRATRRRLPATTAGNRRAVPPAAGRWPSPGPAGAPPCRSAGGVRRRRRPGAAARATGSGFGGAPPGRCARPRNWAAPSRASRSSPRPGTGCWPRFRIRKPWSWPRSARNRSRRAATRRRCCSTVTRCCGVRTCGRGRTPSGAGSTPRRWSGPPVTAVWWSSPRTTQPASGPCCAGTLPATPSGNCPCARNCSCPRPSGSRPSPAAGPPSGTSARPSSSSWASRGSSCGPPARPPS